MKMLTFKLTAKRAFGIILALTGVIVIVITFVSNHTQDSKSVSAAINASTNEQRQDFLLSYGWKTDDNFEEKELTVPEVWNEVYIEYNEIQINQGFDLTDYKGKTVTLYTYTVTNYDGESEGIIADMLVCDGILIGGDICNTSAENGFLVGFDSTP